jgi:endonuclease/exonuclease/phosphatase family metal-dependent hydrolase
MSGGTAKTNTAASLTDLTILTWNVWFDDLEYRRRMDHILNLTLENRPDVACFQEVLQEFADMIFQHPVVKDLYHISPFTTGGYGVLTMVKKEYNPQFSFVNFPSRMGRELLKATFEKDQHQIVVGNVHLESLANQPTRAEQLRICGKELKNAQLPFLVGDFNFCSERNFINIEGKPLENEILTTTLPEFEDLWKLQIVCTSSPDPNPNSGDENERVSTPTKGSSLRSESALGYTFDSQANPMILQEERMRYDRIMAKLGEHYPPSLSLSCSSSRD